MKWTEEHKLLLLRELMLLQPWLHKKETSKKRWLGKAGSVLLFLVHSSVLLISLFVTTSLQWKRELDPRRKKVREEDRASAIAPEEDKELDQLLNEIIELFDESDKAIDETKQKQEEEAKKAEEMQKRSLETFKDSAKRNADEQQGARP